MIVDDDAGAHRVGQLFASVDGRGHGMRPGGGCARRFETCGAGIRGIRDRLLGRTSRPVQWRPSRAGSSAQDRSARSSMRRADAEHTLVRIDMSARAASAVGGAAGGCRSGRADWRLVHRSLSCCRLSTRGTSAVLFASGFCLGCRASRRHRRSLVGRPESQTLDVDSRSRRRLSGLAPARFVLASLAAHPAGTAGDRRRVSCFGALRGGRRRAVRIARRGGHRLCGRPRDWASRPARWMSRRSYRSVRQLGARGVVGVIVLRLAAWRAPDPFICSAARGAFRSRLSWLGTRDRPHAGDRRAQRPRRTASPHAAPSVGVERG